MKQAAYDAYIPTPLRRRLGLLPATKVARPKPTRKGRKRRALSHWIDKSGGPATCWLWKGQVDTSGYGFVTGRGRAHRLVWEQHHKQKLATEEVIRHSCDTPLCCNPAHLLDGTQLQNVQDRVARERSAKGTANGRNKLTEENVKEIFESTDPIRALGLRFGVDESTVRGIQTRKTWRWLTKSNSKVWNKKVSS